MATVRPLVRFAVTGALLILIGLALLVGGIVLVTAGGTPFYLLAGIGFGAAGVLLWRGLAEALIAYAALLAAMLAWSLWEVGLDWWPLAARLDLAFVFGVLLVLPWIARHLRGPQSGRIVLALVVGASAVVAVGAGLRDTHEIAGQLPDAGPAVAATAPARVPDGEWHAYGRTAAGQRWSPLAQVTPDNVARLQVAWQFRTGDVRGRPGDPEETTDEVTPLKIGSRLYFCTPHQSVIALDATTGQQAWRYDPKMQADLALQHQTCRGLSYQPPAEAASATAPAASVALRGSGRRLDIAANDAKARADCGAKLFLATADGRLIALDPDTGAVCSRFGGGAGQIDLGANMPNLHPGSYYSTSPVIVTKRLVIVGGTVLDNFSTREESGVIRAYDIDTGALVWNWDSGNPDVTTPIAADATYTANSPNSWSIASVDEALGLVYLPMGNQPPDQWGGQRSPAVEKYSSSVVALDLATGRVRWVYQTVHHDLWDYDVPSQPSLVDLSVNGTTVPALVQPTKQGELFVLDRRTGQPLLPVAEQPAPQGAAAGDHTAGTQPKSALSYEPARLTGKDMWGGTIIDQMMCRIAFHKLRYEGRFTPPSTQGSLIYPGNFGTFNWGGVAVDPQRQSAFTTPTYLAFVSTLVPRPNPTAELVQNGQPPKGALPALNENFGAPFAVKLHPFTSPLGIPCQAPPWGYVAGADLRTGKVAWEHRNGTVRDLSPIPLPLRMGVPNLGGPVMTAGGVAFLSGSMDDYVRGYDVRTGRQLWEERLPAGGQATPMTYLGADGRQYLLVVAGGHGSTGTRPGDYVIAYALPKP
ncbi:MAG: membrane-bound PQQ-dependent dehydrogenase, glucose/quinate/shikimate family [Burkholderiales bacterium]|nr:membrane-bound PQQ-dependent dehydrogenase, glucose/quinate/shikimate family [Burkholderiales bacterium]